MSVHIRRDGRPLFKVGPYKYVSAGIIPYTIKDGQTFFLLQAVMGRGWDWEDFGGKSDIVDTSIADVAIRECLEELNHEVTREFLISCVSHEKTIVCPIPDSKYMLYLMYIPPEHMDFFTTERFGDLEKLHRIKRTVHWVAKESLHELTRRGVLNPRIQSRMGEAFAA